MNNPTQTQVEATIKTVMVSVPGAAALAASWLEVINAFLGALFLALSIAFMLWRWKVAAKKEGSLDK